MDFVMRRAHERVVRLASPVQVDRLRQPADLPDSPAACPASLELARVRHASRFSVKNAVRVHRHNGIQTVIKPEASRGQGRRDASEAALTISK